MSAGLITGALGIGAAVALGYFAPDCLRSVGLLGFCLLGALFPDIDTDSKGQNIFYSGMIAFDAVLIYHQYYFWAAWRGLFSMLPALGHHRGWTHTWWAMLVVPLPILIIPVMLSGAPGLNIFSFADFYAAFVLGYFSHLLLDRKLS